MKIIVTAIAATLFAASLSADDVYRGLAKGNPDLFDGHGRYDQMAGVQRGIGDSFDVYRGLADGNADLFKTRPGYFGESGDDPNIYHGISGNPDLQY